MLHSHPQKGHAAQINAWVACHLTHMLSPASCPPPPPPELQHAPHPITMLPRKHDSHTASPPPLTHTRPALKQTRKSCLPRGCCNGPWGHMPHQHRLADCVPSASPPTSRRSHINTRHPTQTHLPHITHPSPTLSPTRHPLSPAITHTPVLAVGADTGTTPTDPWAHWSRATV